MLTLIHTLILSVVVFTVVVGAACSRGETTPPALQPQYEPVATVREIMQTVMDPSSDAIWQSVATTVTTAGMVERAPKTEEEWLALRGHALRLVEAGNLLQMPGRQIAKPGEKSSYPGIELGPEEIQAEVDKDRAGWLERARALRESVKPTLTAIDARDAKMLEDAGEHIDTACENCHLKYWYPNAPPPPNDFPDVPPLGEPRSPTQ